MMKNSYRRNSKKTAPRSSQVTRRKNTMVKDHLAPWKRPHKLQRGCFYHCCCWWCYYQRRDVFSIDDENFLFDNKLSKSNKPFPTCYIFVRNYVCFKVKKVFVFHKVMHLWEKIINFNQDIQSGENLDILNYF